MIQDRLAVDWYTGGQPAERENAMEQELRQLYLDRELGVEACRFRGIGQGFPEHFHPYYVLGLVEQGHRSLTIGGTAYTAGAGDVVVFHPEEPHACTQLGEQRLDWRSLNVPAEVMEGMAEAVTGRPFRPRFSPPVQPRSELAPLLREVWQLAAGERGKFRKEEAFLLLIGRLLETSGGCSPEPAPVRTELQAVCRYLEEHYARRITLEELSALAGLSKYYLLRCFTRQKGITPYRYLETVRVEQAKALLERGAPPAEAALRAGFADQSHFNRFFKTLIGLPPGQYQAAFQAGKEQT